MCRQAVLFFCLFVVVTEAKRQVQVFVCLWTLSFVTRNVQCDEKRSGFSEMIVHAESTPYPCETATAQQFVSLQIS